MDEQWGLFQSVFDRTPALAFGGLWSYLSPDELCRGPLSDPAGTLQSLNQKFSPATLQRAGLVEPTLYDGWRLRPELCNPSAGLIGLRRDPTRPIEGLITGRGSLPDRLGPLALAARDGELQRSMGEEKVLLITFSFRDTALLRALGMPAVLGLGLHKLDLASMQAINDLAGTDDYVPPLPAEVAPAAASNPGENPAPAPSPANAILPAKDDSAAIGGAGVQLVLVGWSPCLLTFPYLTQLQRVARHFCAFRRHLRMPLAGVSVWQPSEDDLEKLQFRLRWPNRENIAEFLRETIEDAHDLEEHADSDSSSARSAGSAVTDLISAQARLTHELASDYSPGRRDRLREARADYERWVRAELVQPLQVWAMSHSNPLVRLAGMELANVSSQLFRLGPELRSSAEGADERGVNDYTKMMKQFALLLRELVRLRDS